MQPSRVTRGLGRELPAAERIPYSRARVRARRADRCSATTCRCFGSPGASFESADDEQLNTWHERLNVLWRNIASPHVALWTHRDPPARASVCTRAESRRAVSPASLSGRYRERLAGETLMVNELYLVARLSARRQGRRRALHQGAARRSTVAASGARAARCARCLREAAPDVAARRWRATSRSCLGRLRHGAGACCSRLLEFLGAADQRRMAARCRCRVRRSMRCSRPRGSSSAPRSSSTALPTQTRWGAMLGIKEYPTPTRRRHVQRAAVGAVSVRADAVVRLSDARPAAQGLLQRQFNRMANAGDFAVSQAEELNDALDALTSNEFVMGDHHFSLQVLADADRGRRSDTAARRLTGAQRPRRAGAHVCSPIPA